MSIGKSEPNLTASDHVLDWLGDSVSFPSFFDDPCHPDDINSYEWWNETQEVAEDFLLQASFVGSNTTTVSSEITSLTATSSVIPDNHPQSNLSKRKRSSDELVPRTSQMKNQIGRVSEGEEGGSTVQEVKRSVGNKKSKSTGNNCNNGNNKEGRWAEQLLNPCTMAIMTGNLTRVQHLLYVLHELASPTGDANHRLAYHGLKALTHHLSSSSSSSSSAGGPVTFASSDPRFLQRSLLQFYELSPWFAFPNKIANSSILQVLDQEPDKVGNLHILDIGVSHGVQWPTLLEALTRRSGGPPPLVRITVVSASCENDRSTETPFSVGPSGDNFSSRLLAFAKTMNINLQINRLDGYPLQSLDTQIINTSSDETLIVCAQFRLHHLNHNSLQDERSEFLKLLRSFEPKGVFLSENNMECSCKNCGDFTTSFSRRLEYLWTFLDSTSSAFKCRESEERRLMEGEAAKVLTNTGEMNEGKEKWFEKMRKVGFKGVAFEEDGLDGGRALLRKYDTNWEMRVDEKDGCITLGWKGQPVSFCSLWKLDSDTNN